MQEVPQFVLRRLSGTVANDSHPDAELLTAYSERSLHESERTWVMEHLARCSDCRAVIALALPGTDDAEAIAAARPARKTWSGWTILSWGIATAAIVAIASIGIVQYRVRRINAEKLNASLTAQKEMVATTEQRQTEPYSTPSAMHDVRPQTKTPAEESKRENAPPIRHKDSSGDDSARRPNSTVTTQRRSYAAGSGTVAGASSGTGSYPTENAKLAQAPSPVQPAVPSSSETVEVESQASATTPEAESHISNQLQESQKEQAVGQQSSTDLDAAKASAQWSINPDGRLQRSLDAGKTWIEINPDVAATRSVAGLSTTTSEVARANKKVKAQRSAAAGFQALAAFGTEVWVGGVAGMLYHSTDGGSHWARVVPFSSGVTLTEDVTSIEFADPQHGSISTSDGKVWITTNAGVTWRSQ